jgi:hypothetical protein
VFSGQGVVQVRTVGIVGFDDGVGDGEELAGDGDQGDLGWFTGLAHGSVVGAEVGFMASGAERGHVERGAHARATAGDAIAARGEPALVGVWGEASEAGGGAPIEGAEFGQVGDEHGCDLLTNSRDRGEQPQLGGRTGIGGEGLVELGLDTVALGGEGSDGRAVAGNKVGVIGLLEAGLLDGDHLDKLPAAAGERLGQELVDGRQGAQGVGHAQSEACDERRVQPVGSPGQRLALPEDKLGVTPFGIAESFDAPWVDEADLEAGGGQCLDEAGRVGSDCLENHATDAGTLESLKDGGDTLRCVGSPQAPAGGGDCEVKKGFADIDTGGELKRHGGSCPVFGVRRGRPQATVRNADQVAARLPGSRARFAQRHRDPTRNGQCRNPRGTGNVHIQGSRTSAQGGGCVRGKLWIPGQARDDEKEGAWGRLRASGPSLLSRTAQPWVKPGMTKV